MDTIDMSGTEGLTLDETVELAVDTFDNGLFLELSLTDRQTLRNFMYIVAQKSREEFARGLVI